MEAAVWNTNSHIVNTILKAIPDGAFVIDRNGFILFANKQLENALGLDRHAIIGHRLRDLPVIATVTDVNMAQARGSLQSLAIKGRLVRNVECMIKHLSKATISMSASIYPLTDSTNERIGALITLADLTKRRMTEKIQQDRYQHLIERSLEPIFIHSAGKICSVNTAFMRYLQIADNRKLIKKSLFNFVHPTHHQSLKEQIKCLEKSECLYPVKVRFFRGDGKAMDAELYSIPLFLHDEPVLLTIVRDITEKRQLQAEQEFKSQLLSRALDSILVYEMSDTLFEKFCYVNDASCALTGYNKDELLKLSQLDLVAVYHETTLHLKMKSLLKNKSVTFESVYKRKDKTVIPVEIHARLIDFANRQLVVNLVHDLTERRKEKTRQESEDKYRKELDISKEFSEALNNINMLINSTLEFDEVMRRVIVEATESIGAESSAIYLKDDDDWIATYVYGLPSELKGMRFNASNIPITTDVALAKEIIAINDAYHDQRVRYEPVKTYRIHSMLIVPLIIRGESIGTLVFNYHTAQSSFSEHQIDFANKLSASLSLALENAKRYAATRDIADTLQEALLTVPDKLPGIQFGHLYRSSTEASRVCGDFYDLFDLGDGCIGIIIGDVSGKGLEAAALTAVIKDTIKAYAYESGLPASVMAKANKVIQKTVPDHIFATVFLGILDTTERNLSYCNAGHPPPILLKATSDIVLLATNSPMVGAFQGLSYIADEIQLIENDILICYTDGATEARSGNELFGEERLLSFLRNVENPYVADLPWLIFTEVMKYTSGRLTDDIAILCASLHDQQ